MSFLKQKIILVVCSLFLLLSASFLPLPVAAAGGLVPCGTSTTPACKFTDLFVLVAEVTNFLIASAGLYAVYKLIQAGFWMVMSVGNEEKITQMKNQLTEAILGFVLVMMAYMFVNTTVNVLLTRSLVTANPNGQTCSLDLKDPKSYLLIKQDPCSSLPENTLHK
jgi:hypothetical protein